MSNDETEQNPNKPKSQQQAHKNLFSKVHVSSLAEQHSILINKTPCPYASWDQRQNMAQNYAVAVYYSCITGLMKIYGPIVLSTV